MNQEAFVQIIEALQEQKHREEKFTEAIRAAFIDAGGIPDFHNADSFTPPTGVMVDKILEALSFGFIGANQTQEEAYDHINYFFYELDMMNYMFMEPEDPSIPFDVKPVPAYYISKDGSRLPLATPVDLYNSLVYEMTANRPGNSNTTQESVESILDDPEFRKLYDMVVDVIDNNLGVTELGGNIDPTTNIFTDVGPLCRADSLNSVEIIMSLENRLGRTFSDEDWEELQGTATPLAITQWIFSRLHK